MSVDVTYRGLKVAQGARLVASEPGSGFVEVETPLPVGSRVALTGEVEKEVRVISVVEQEAGSKTVAGMRVVWDEPVAASTVTVTVTVAEPEPEPEPVVPVAPEAAATIEDLEGATLENPILPEPSPEAAGAPMNGHSQTAKTVPDMRAEPEPDPGDSGSMSSPPADETPGAAGGGSRRRRKRKSANRS